MLFSSGGLVAFSFKGYWISIMTPMLLFVLCWSHLKFLSYRVSESLLLRIFTRSYHSFLNVKRLRPNKKIICSFAGRDSSVRNWDVTSGKKTAVYLENRCLSHPAETFLFYSVFTYHDSTLYQSSVRSLLHQSSAQQLHQRESLNSSFKVERNLRVAHGIAI